MNQQLDPERLLVSQLQDFDLARTNYKNLERAQYKTLIFPDFSFRLQYNPDRIRSTAAKLDEKTLKERKCFLCPANLPPFQKGIPYGGRYTIFVNPYPIFRKHFTVPAREHIPQLIEGRFPDMLSLAKDFPAYTIFYNGPRSGASAPDHFHFQMAQRHVMPLETDTLHPVILQNKGYYRLGTLRNYIRKVLLFESQDREVLNALFTGILEILSRFVPNHPEPMLNLLCWHAEDKWTVVLFPRRELRPWQFFAEGEDKILFSPGSVDFGGLLVTPRKEDFERYTPHLLTDLFGQLTLTDETWHQLLSCLRELCL